VSETVEVLILDLLEWLSGKDRIAETLRRRRELRRAIPVTAEE